LDSYRLTPRAERQLVDIFRYGIDNFGAEVARHYASSLEHCFELLVNPPQMGRQAPDFGEGVRRHTHQRHIILYEIRDDAIVILAVLPVRSLARLLTPR
jgi:toxin ParE1/3/4